MLDAQESRPRMVLVNRSIIIKNNLILLLQRSKHDSFMPGSWEFPGGKLDPGQDITNALEREILEETGFLITPLERIAYYESLIISSGKYAGLPYVTLIGISRVTGGDLKLSEEHDDYAWVTQKDALDYNISDESKKALITLESRLNLFLSNT